MAVGLDAVMTGGNDGGDVQSVSNGTSFSAGSLITVGGSATLLVIGCSFQRAIGAMPSSITATWNGASMSAGPLISISGSVAVLATMFYKVNPASGANTLAVSWTNAADLYCGAISFTGTDTSTGINAADNQTASGHSGSSSNVTVPTANGDATVACSVTNSNDPTSNQTKFYGAADLNPGGGGAYVLSTGTSDAFTWTYTGGVDFAGVGMHILAGTGGGPAPSFTVPFRRPLRFYT